MELKTLKMEIKTAGVFTRLFEEIAQGSKWMYKRKMEEKAFFKQRFGKKQLDKLFSAFGEKINLDNESLKRLRFKLPDSFTPNDIVKNPTISSVFKTEVPHFHSKLINKYHKIRTSKALRKLPFYAGGAYLGKKLLER